MREERILTSRHDELELRKWIKDWLVGGGGRDWSMTDEWIGGEEREEEVKETRIFVGRDGQVCWITRGLGNRPMRVRDPRMGLISGPDPDLGTITPRNAN